MASANVMRPATQAALSLEDLLVKLRAYLTEEKLPLVEQAYQYAAEKHAGQFRKSGGPYIEHPLNTALLVADLRLDTDAVVAALLHDVPEDCGVPLEEIEGAFGSEVRRLVDGVTKLSKLALPASGEPLRRRDGDAAGEQAENLRKMLVAMAEDIRVVLIKLADRLHNMRTLGALPPPKRREIALETTEIYAPLAHRLGIWEFKWELEDLAFRHLQPQKYREVERLVAAQRDARERYIAQVTGVLQQELAKVGIAAEVLGRPKHLFSVFSKIEKYRAQGKDFDQIYDLLALRIIVEGMQDCYSALGVVHSLWRPLPGQFDDYISNARENGYQALHTTVMCEGAQPLEVQIRTKEMHHVAEYGVAAHWRYKDGTSKDMRFEERLTWLRQLLEWQRDLGGAEEFVESVKTDIFHDQVFVYTPKGEIKDLPLGATPLDFAYRIHTDLGHRCIGAKVNGKLVPLNSQLHTGEVVEILTTKQARGPSRDWLNPNLGHLKTSNAQQKVRQWFRRQERAESVERGRELVERELRRLGVPMDEQEHIAHLFKYNSLEDFLAAVGYGDVLPNAIAQKLAAQQERPPIPLEAPSRPTTAVSPGIRVLGVGDLLTQMARCCTPVPGDDIIGFITRTRGVVVHQKACTNIINSNEKERLIKVEWGGAKQLYAVPVRVQAWDRVGLLRDISTVVSGEGVNMAQVSVTEADGTASILMNLEVTGIGQLTQLLSKLEGVPGVLSVVRGTEGAKREG